jgi:hypothetical protein
MNKITARWAADTTDSECADIMAHTTGQDGVEAIRDPDLDPAEAEASRIGSAAKAGTGADPSTVPDSAQVASGYSAVYSAT